MLAISSPVLAATKAELIAEKFSAYHGQVVLVDFWASWCGPCRRSFPWMNAMQAKYGAQNFTVIAINVDKDPTDADKFLDKYPAEFMLWYDSAGELASLFEVSTMPTSFILDVNGTVRSAHRGFLSDKVQRYEAAIAQAIADPVSK